MSVKKEIDKLFKELSEEARLYRDLTEDQTDRLPKVPEEMKKDIKEKLDELKKEMPNVGFIYVANEFFKKYPEYKQYQHAIMISDLI